MTWLVKRWIRVASKEETSVCCYAVSRTWKGSLSEEIFRLTLFRLPLLLPAQLVLPSKMTSSDMHFGPSWMQNASRSTTKRSQNHQPAVAASPAAAAAEPTHPSYSSIALPPAPPSNVNASSLGYENASKPFKYSKEYMLGMWDDAVQRERELPIEFERWDVVFREETDGPVGLKPLSEAEKKASLSQ
jgi:hypothetical protein